MHLIKVNHKILVYNVLPKSSSVMFYTYRNEHLNCGVRCIVAINRPSLKIELNIEFNETQNLSANETLFSSNV